MVLLVLHGLLAGLALALLVRQFLAPAAGRWPVLLVSGGIGLALGSGLVVMAAQGGLARSLFFGHVMHWLGWMAVLTWLHAVARRKNAVPAAGLPLLLTAAASIAGLLALVQERV